MDFIFYDKAHYRLWSVDWGSISSTSVLAACLCCWLRASAAGCVPPLLPAYLYYWLLPSASAAAHRAPPSHSPSTRPPPSTRSPHPPTRPPTCPRTPTNRPLRYLDSVFSLAIAILLLGFGLQQLSEDYRAGLRFWTRTFWSDKLPPEEPLVEPLVAESKGQHSDAAATSAKAFESEGAAFPGPSEAPLPFGWLGSIFGAMRTRNGVGRRDGGYGKPHKELPVESTPLQPIEEPE